MKRIAAIALAAALAMPASSQQEDGLNLMEEGAKLFMRGLMDEMQPALDDLSMLAEEWGPQLELLSEEMGPALMELMDTIDSITHYQAPELMPNGDIIIRRKPDAPEYIPEDGIEL